MHDDSTATGASDAIGAEVKVPVFAEGEVERLEALAREFMQLYQRTADLGRQLESALSSVQQSLRTMRSILDTPTRPVVKDRRVAVGTLRIATKGPRTILDVLSTAHELDRKELARLCGFSNSTLRTYLPALRTAGYVTETDGLVNITDAGRNFIA